MSNPDRVFFVVAYPPIGDARSVRTIAARTWYLAREHARQLFGTRLIDVSAQVEGADPADADIRVGDGD